MSSSRNGPADSPGANPWADKRDGERVLQEIDSRRGGEGRTRTLVAIDGRGGSGKSSLASFLVSRLSDVVVIHTDDFARPGVPGWDWPRFRRQVVDPLLRGEAGRYQRYDWTEDRLAEWHDVPRRGVVIVEGVSSMRRELDVPWDLTVWVETPKEIRLARGIERDGEAMRSLWENVWDPEEDRYVQDQRPGQRADVIATGTLLENEKGDS